MRKPRDFDSELRALTDKAKLLKERKQHQLGELVVSTGADAMPVEHLAGALLTAIDTQRQRDQGGLAQARCGILSTCRARNFTRR